jgi:hypothetical protein
MMRCHHCGAAADRACTQCGRFFCSSHGGPRKVVQYVGRGMMFPERVLCDACTPDQESVQASQEGYQALQVFYGIIAIGVLIFIGWIVVQMLKGP